jgi:ATP-dependent RNA helicase RhlE
LDNFKEGNIKVLIATDIAARGIDIDKLSLVVNYDLPNIPETYVHRIGRTGRAKESGEALSFCSDEELVYLRDIQYLIKQEITQISDQPFHDASLRVPTGRQKAPGKSKPQGRPNQGPKGNAKKKFYRKRI